MPNARETALLTLDACERQGAWSNAFLKKAIRSGGLDRRDAALATRLCFGVLQNRLLLDFYVAGCSTVKPEKLERRVLCALRIALYQLTFLEKIPASAAVNESVELARKYSRNPRSPALVNGILRGFLRAGSPPPVEGRDTAERLSIQYSHPRWLVEEFLAALGPAEAEALLEADNTQPPTVAQLNTVRFSAEEAAQAVRGNEVQAEPHPWLPGCLLLAGTGDLEELAAFQDGAFYVQDAAARLSVLASGVKAGDSVLDCCAAPGGKSFAAAIQMENRGEIVSCDIHPHKLRLIGAGRDRLGLSCIQVRGQNAKEYVPEWEGAFDAVLADVPCSGLGIIRKKPDIRYKDRSALAGLPAVQRDILGQVCRYVRPGGTLLYSTCTLLRRENEEVVEDFLKEHPQFRLEPFSLPGPIGRCDGTAVLWPHRHGTDGFFIAKLRRTEEA